MSNKEKHNFRSYLAIANRLALKQNNDYCKRSLQNSSTTKLQLIEHIFTVKLKSKWLKIYRIGLEKKKNGYQFERHMSLILWSSFLVHSARNSIEIHTSNENYYFNKTGSLHMTISRWIYWNFRQLFQYHSFCCICSISHIFRHIWYLNAFYFCIFLQFHFKFARNTENHA